MDIRSACKRSCCSSSPTRKLDGVFDVALGARHNCAITAADVFVPDQLELTFERSAGSDRYGATLSWGI